MKRAVRYFVSYAHEDGKIPDQLLTGLAKELNASEDYEFERWHDSDILPGEQWHDEIQRALNGCDFGLLLVSPSFLGSKYIGQHELPRFISGEKPCVPVGLLPINFNTHDLKGLKAAQIFRLPLPRDPDQRAFGDCVSAKHKRDFARELSAKIVARLAKLFASTTVASATTTSNIGIPGAVAIAHIPSTSIPHNLPTLQPFFGREEELRKIADALDPDSRTWGALIDGPGGMGKTSLAVRAAYDASPDAFKKIIFISLKTRELDDDGVRDLSGFLISGLIELLNELARELGCDDIPKAPEDQRPRLLLDQLRNTQTLLVLDNLESLLKKERDTLFTFVKKLPAGCKAILTSRGRIGSGAEELILEKLSEEAALATLAELATHNPLLAQTSEAERLVLYRETAGKPLLLRWTAGQLGRGHCLTFIHAIEHLRSCPLGNDPLEFIFGDLVEDFSEAESKVICALTYFTLPASVEHIHAIADPSKQWEDPDEWDLDDEDEGEGKSEQKEELSIAAVETALRSLANRSLAVPTDELKTFTLVPMVADFLRKKKPEVVAETGDRLEKRAYALIVENGYDDHNLFPVLDAAWPTVAPALPLFLAGSNTRFQTVCNALDAFLNFTGRWDELFSLSQQAEAKAIAAGDKNGAGWRAFQVGWINYLRKQGDLVLACAERAKTHWKNSQAHVGKRALAIRLRGLGYKLSKDYAAAIKAFREALKAYRTLSPESYEVATALNSLADAERLSGNDAAAEKNYSEALRVGHAIGNAEIIAGQTGNLGELAFDLKDWPRAETLSREALELSGKVGRHELVASNNYRLAKALVRQGKAAEALPYARRAVEIFTRLGSPNREYALATLWECEKGIAE